MAFQSLCFGCLLGRGGQDELQKLNTNSLAQMQPRRTFIATCFFPPLCKGIRGDPPFSGTWHIPLEVGFPGLLPRIGKRLCILFYPNVLQPLTGLTCSPLFRPQPPQISRQKKKAGAAAGSSFSSYVFYPQRVLKKWPSCSPAGTWPALLSRWISSSSCQAALVLVQTHVITCNMDTIPSFLRAPGPSRRKRRQKIKHGRNRRQRSCCCRLCLEQKNEYKGRDRAGG